MAVGRQLVESADCYLLGSVNAVCSAALARRVRFKWGYKDKYPNLFSMMAGPPGARKSSAIELAKKLAWYILPPESFLPKAFSAESLFDEYDDTKGGLPDKLGIWNEGKTLLTDWKESAQGRRTAALFLSLYDCEELTENYRRNATRSNPKTKRIIPETSTSVIVGATFGDAHFQGQDVKAGMARRFLFHVAEDAARVIVKPVELDLFPVIKLFLKLPEFAGVCDFEPEANKLWTEYQYQNRRKLSDINRTKEAETHRLTSAPMQTLSVTMVYEACRVAKSGERSIKSIRKETLQKAINYVDDCLEAACFLDTASERNAIEAGAEIFLERIRKDYQSESGKIILSRSQIIIKYASHPGRTGDWKLKDIFEHWIPELSRQGHAKILPKQGKREIFEFLAN
jgi:hypothetical protein